MRPRLLLFCLVCFVSAFRMTDALAQTKPSDVVETLHITLTEVMRNADTLGITGRYEKLAATLPDLYDFPRMIRIIAGSSWKSAGARQDELVKAFARLSLATYASQFSGYSGETFEMLGQREGPRKTRIIDTRIIIPNKTPVPISYILYDGGQGWKIVDVLLAAGISELAVRRSEYRAILKSDGVEGLIDVLHKKADELLATP